MTSVRDRYDAQGLDAAKLVSERNLARDALAESEQRFRQLAEHIDDVLFLEDLDATEVYYVSPAYERIWGRTCASLYADPASGRAAIHPDDRAPAHSRFQDGRVTGFEQEYRIVRPDGAERWVHVRAFPILDAAGRPYRMAVIASDITLRMEAAQALRESDRRLSDMLGNVQLAAVMLDNEARITYCNEYLLRLTGWRIEEVTGRDWFEVFMPPDLGDMRPVFRALLAGKREAWHVESEIYTRTGVRRLVRWNNTVLYSAAGEATGVASLGEDITAQKQAEVRVKRLNRVYAVLSRVNALIVRVRERGELFREASRIAVEQGGFVIAWIGEVDRAAGLVRPIASHGDVRDFFEAARLGLEESSVGGIGLVGRCVRDMKPMVANDMRSDPLALRRKAMTERGILSIGIIPLIVGDETVGVMSLYSEELGFFDDEELGLLLELGEHISFAIANIGQHKMLDYLAYYDVLTGLANRGLFLERVAQYVRGAQHDGHQLALYLIDLERFKNINDSLGQSAGDTLLRLVAHWLTTSTGDANLLARVGPDLFAAVLPQVQQGGEVARRLEKMTQDFLEHPFVVADAVLRVGAKIGVALYPADGATADALFKNAEAALRRGKRQAERIVFYAAEMNARVAEALAIETRLRRAIERREFVLHYQPKVSLVSGHIVGAEALIRWQDPDKGLVAPASFIPVLEETGMIVEVGRWVVEQAFADLREMAARGLAIVRVAVNVSAIQLQRKGFVEDMVEDIRRGGDRPEWLELEITESLVMRNVEDSIRKLSILRGMGVTITIDDFGTGYSSLSYLGRLPLDSLKIDRSFVSGLTGARESATIVSTIVELARGLKLKVVAEGVETQEQLDALKRLRCDEAQGFYFGRPVPCAEFESRYLAQPLIA
jgi:diguanylate cyclase (GGDEF)-like protein/PAS domain S-box-containing protein